MKTFSEWNALFQRQNMFAFNADASGVVWLKLKSMRRRDILNKFLADNNLIVKATSLDGIFTELYAMYVNKKLPSEDVDKFLRSYNAFEMHDMARRFTTIEANLYKVKDLSWGGDLSNSLDKQIVSIVKDTSSYDDICKKFDNEMTQNAYNYTISTWYNHWSAILTEHLFKRNVNVLSAIGKIKSVDFFIKDVPLDLKITYFPKEFLKEERKKRNLKSELTILKKIARENNVQIIASEKEDVLKYQLMEQLRDLNRSDVNEQLKTLIDENNAIIDASISDKYKLIKWLYENQGAMRFGSENRLFLVLIDKRDLTHSWKLKRNFTLQNQHIESYLNNFNVQNLIHNKINFSYGGTEYSALADAVFISVE